MNKTAQQIEDDILNRVLQSQLPGLVDGGVYRFGTRPFNSTREDIVVKFVTGLDGQWQSGVAVVNTYVPDISNGDGTTIRNITRCRAIESKVLEFVQRLNPDPKYLFSTDATIQTISEPDIKQHFINLKLKFKLKTF